jgi:hypothetical protein
MTTTIYGARVDDADDGKRKHTIWVDHDRHEVAPGSGNPIYLGTCSLFGNAYRYRLGVTKLIRPRCCVHPPRSPILIAACAPIYSDGTF